MKNIFKRLMNFLLIIFIGLAFAMTIKVYEKNELYEGCAEIVTAVKFLKGKDIKKK